MAPTGPRSVLSPMQASAGATDSPASIPIGAVTLKAGNESIPYLDLPRPALLSFANFDSSKVEDEHSKLTSAMQVLSLRVDRLLSFSEQADTSHSEALQACTLSLRTRMPLVLRQTEQLIERVGNETTLVCKMRSTLALFRAVQYLDRIQEGMDPELNDGLDQQLRTVLAGLDLCSLPEAFKSDLSFRISPWVPSVLGFDLPLGESAHASLERCGLQLPINVEVEPVVEFRADDCASVRYAHHAARACKVTIETCKHIVRDFGLGAGMIGEATIRVRLSPLDCVNQKIQIWGRDKEVQSLHIKEARA